jgi:hypothetical protein
MLLALAISAGVKWTSAGTAPQAGSDLLRLLPDGKGVAVIDVQKVTSSSLWSTLSAQNPIKKGLDDAQAELSKLGVRLTDISTAAVVFSTSGGGSPTVAVTGAFNQAQLLEGLKAQPNVKLTSENYKGQEVFNVGNATKPSEGAFTFVDARTVVAGSLANVRASIDVRSGARPSIAQNSKLAAALASNSLAAVSFALETPPQMTNAANSAPVPLPDFSSVKLIFGTVDVTTAIDVNATLRTDNVEDAKNIADRLNGLLDMARAYLGAMTSDPKMAGLVQALKTVSITGNDVDVKITGSLPQEILTQLIR